MLLQDLQVPKLIESFLMLVGYNFDSNKKNNDACICRHSLSYSYIQNVNLAVEVCKIQLKVALEHLECLLLISQIL